MARKRDIKLIPKGSLNAEQAEELFGTVDETGHTNEETARAQRKQRRSRGHGVDIDPLSDAGVKDGRFKKAVSHRNEKIGVWNACRVSMPSIISANCTKMRR